jgi:hypothetical protein
MTVFRVLRSVFVAAVLAAIAFGQRNTDDPIKTTLCEIVKAPEQFNGKMVQVRALVNGVEEASVLYDGGCSASVLLVASGDDALWQGKDAKQQRRLTASLKKHSFVTVTVIGRFEHAPARQFGHQNMFDSRIVMVSVYDVVTKAGGHTAGETKQ